MRPSARLTAGALLGPALLGTLLLGGCTVAPPRFSRPAAGTPLPAPPAGETRGDLLAIPDAVPRIEPRSKFGNPPFYDVLGHRYYVLPSASGYVARGVASWYGPTFHGVRTAIGEPYGGLEIIHHALLQSLIAEMHELVLSRK